MDILVIAIIAIVSVIIIDKTISGLFKKPELTKEQKECNHEWYRLNSSRKSYYFSIYCPKCKLSKLVDEYDWSKMQIDKEYEERSNN